ncbi:hypothetical protein BGW36DRAFT_465533 [Talaromyces proteolyticus]|uniref:Uncharacterized protein n=1 Tax=Talaromyces proteolyticus TaxID=1131652 RepID=A0AAD4KFA9_9EURO|nr:uncharacterized protein BGW36DRAFT_465533 [Talaromyces proteolyticus]KAH8690642.1 hypothetical protein BGW36DRAFT_465533 [Talaromyces proteolyticus]
MSLKDLAVSFFSLPHPRTDNDGIENHYHFSIFPAAYSEPDDDIIQVVKVANQFTHIGGPMKLRVLPLQKRVDTVLRFLFTSFTNGLPTSLNNEIQHVLKQLNKYAKFCAYLQTTIPNGIGNGDYGSPTPRPPRRLIFAEGKNIAPCSWSTDDAIFAQAMSARLRELAGPIYIHHTLVDIQIANERDNRAALTTYIAFQHSLIRGIKKQTTDILRGANAGSWYRGGSLVPFTPVNTAGRTLITSPIYEEEDEDEDEETSNGFGRVGRFRKSEATVPFNHDPDGDYPDPTTYYNTKAYRVRGACNLAARINLVLRKPHDSQIEPESIIIPLRRLIITATDTSHNLSLLLGPRFQSSAATQSLYTSTRMKTILIPPIGSDFYSFFHPLDRGCPYRQLGSPTPAERKMCSAVSKLLCFVKQKMGTVGRVLKEDEVSRMMEMWVNEGRGPLEMDVWKYTIGCLDQGLQPDNEWTGN